MHIKSNTLLTTTVSIIALIAIVMLNGCAALRPTATVDFTGAWKANMQTPQGDMEVLMKISKSSAGEFTATIDAPAMDAYDIPLFFSFENDIVHYEVQGARYSFDGKLTDSSTIEGSSSQPDGTRALIFKRVE
ncbi:hypothetical protein ES705_09262 [subsurface metagenome]